ncbi:HepT-like ribonuclease domain-containing protein [Limnobacter sp.]
MRNAIAHGYFKVDFEIVWNTVQKSLPQLYNMIKSVSLTLG